MKRKLVIFVSVLLGCLHFGVLGQCEEFVTYSNEYASFDYVEGLNCRISYSGRDNSADYVCLTEMKEDGTFYPTAGIRIFNIADYEESAEIEKGAWKEHYFCNSSNEYCEKEVTVEGDMPEMTITYTDENECVGYAKLLGYSSKDFAVATCQLNPALPELSDLCKTIYDSASVSDHYCENGYNSDEEFTVETIYSNVILSEQGANYAKAAIDVLEQYLAFEIDSGSASKQIDEIQSRCESYSETSEYVYDSSVSTKLYVTSLSIDLENDASVSETLQYLKGLLNIE